LPQRTYPSEALLLGVAQDSQNILDGDVTPEPENPRTHGQIPVGTLTFIIDAKDQVRQAGPTIERQLAVEIFGGPETDDLEDPAPPSIAAMPQNEVREQESIARHHRLRFTNDLPVSRCATKSRANRSSILLS
jgi:hypothetical protein